MAIGTPETDPHWNLIRNVILPEAKEQSDRALVVIMAAVVDDQLTELLKNTLVNDPSKSKKFFTGMGPLSTFSAKIDMGYMIALYDKDFAALLHAVRNLRNMYAHDMRPLTFASKEVTDKMTAFSFIDRFHDRKLKALRGRERFIASCEACLGGIAAIGSDKKRFRSPRPGHKATKRAT